MGVAACETGDGYGPATGLLLVLLVLGLEELLVVAVALDGDDRSPGGMYCRMMMSLVGDTPGPSSSRSLSPEKRVNCFWVSSTILRALRSR